MPSPRTTPSLLANSAWNMLAFGCLLASNLITVPLVVAWIGIDAFGVAGLVIAICAPLAFVGNSLAQALVREKSWRLQLGDFDGASAHACAAVQMTVVASGAGVAMIVLTGPSVASCFGAAGPSGDAGAAAFTSAAAAWFAQQISTVLQAIPAARQDFRRIALTNAIAAAASVTFTLAVTAAVPTAPGYLAALAGGLWVAAACWAVSLRNHLPWRSLLTRVHTAPMRGLLRFGAWQAPSQLAGILSTQADRYALGSMGTMAFIGQYNVAKRLQESASVGVTKAGEALVPKFGALSVESPVDQARLFLNASWGIGLFSAAVVVPIAALARPLLQVWIGPAVTTEGEIVLVTLGLAALVGSGSTTYFAHAFGTGRNRAAAAVSVLHSSCAVLLTVAAVSVLGPAAAGSGVLAANLIRLTLALFLAHRALRSEVPLLGVLASVLPSILAGGLVTWACRCSPLAWIEGWSSLVLAGTSTAVVSVGLTMALAAATPHGRMLVLRSWGAVRAVAGRRAGSIS